ncbi:hypothetical protein B0H14DRAFT_2604152 [Mycena olivaceomarginata]|nr:hypothetical protein B0H14DRAFT_2604152 [Mycena olivaceomarginata]
MFFSSALTILLFLCPGLTRLLRTLVVLGVCLDCQWHVHLPNHHIFLCVTPLFAMAPPGSTSGSLTPCGVMALAPDNGDNAWEDENAQLQGLGTTTHHSHNPHKPVIAHRGKQHSCIIGAKRSANEEAARVNTRATIKKCQETRILTSGKWQEESEEHMQELAATYGKKLKEVRRRMHTAPAFRDWHKMVKEDPLMLEGFLKEGEEEMLAGIQEKHETKHRGAWANNLATSADAKHMVEHLMEEITGLAERSGMISFAMFTCGHIHDSSIPVTIESWGTLSFFREISKRDPADISVLFKLWGVTHARGQDTNWLCRNGHWPDEYFDVFRKGEREGGAKGVRSCVAVEAEEGGARAGSDNDDEEEEDE